MNKENCALKLVDEILLYYDAGQKNIKIHNYIFLIQTHNMVLRVMWVLWAYEMCQILHYIIKINNFYSIPTGATTHCGFVFLSPLAGL